MKICLSFFLVALVAIAPMKGQSSGNSVIDALLSAYSPRNYNSEPVTDQQLELILKCGIKAPSASNRQPWKFTVIRDDTTMKAIIPAAIPGNVLILVSGVETPQPGSNFDFALATQNMFIASSALGLGARIYGGPVGNANKIKEALQVPAGYKVITILRIGNIDKSVDAVSAATPRKSYEEIVNFMK